MIRISTGDICIEIGDNQSVQIVNQHIYINTTESEVREVIVPHPPQAPSTQIVSPQAEAEPVLLDPKQAELQERAKEGAICFAGMIEDWKKNFGVEGAPQPDRGKLLVDSMTHYSLYIFPFVRACGGLTKAVIAVSQSPDSNHNGKDFRQHCRLIAENIAQVGSILCPPISELLEYPFKP